MEMSAIAFCISFLSRAGLVANATGANKRMIPRLVLVPTEVFVALTDSKIALPPSNSKSDF